MSKKKRNTCAALSAAGTECSRPPLNAVQWCPRHNEVWCIETKASAYLTDGAGFNPQERLKLYSSYKAHGALLKAYPYIPACYDVATIMACHSISTLREWNAHLRGNYNLLTRCIEARDYFTRRFFGPDMDFGHKVFWDGLVRKRSEVEQLMLHVETRGYQLILRDQDALWVLEKDTHEIGGCSGDHAHGSDEPFHSADDAEGAVIGDPLEAVLRERAIEFREKIRMHLVWYSADTTSPFYNERLEVIWACVRRAIYKDASLMFLSHSYDSAMALLNDQDLDLTTIEKIWRAIHGLCIHDIQSAVDDVVRSTDGDHVVVLGGKVFKDDGDERWPLRAWSYMMAVRHCYTCLRAICLTIDDIIDLTRCTWITWAPLGQSYPKYSFSIEGPRELMMAGFIFNDVPLSSPRYSIVCKDAGSPSTGPLWEETRRNLCLSGGLSLNDPKAQAFANACIRHPDFMVMLRKGKDARVIRSSSVVWTSRTRRARSPSELPSIPWEKATDVVCLSESALEEAQPFGWYRERIPDCLQIVIVDASQDTMTDFVQKLVRIWYELYNVGDVIELFNAIEASYEEPDELDDFQCVTGKIALDRYESLWGCTPSPALVENPERFRPDPNWCY